MQKTMPYLCVAVTCLLLIGTASLVSMKKATAGEPLGSTFIRDVDNPARSPYQEVVRVVIPNGAVSGQVVLPGIPAGKQLVIEYVSASGYFALGQSAYLQVGIVDSAIRHFVPLLQRFNTGVRTRIIGGQETRIYIEAGKKPSISVIRDGTTGDAIVDVGISGYFVLL
jgi:hypothetical protein